MKRLILGSILSLLYAAVGHAQEKPQLELIPPQKLLEFPRLVNPDSSAPVHRLTQLTLKGTWSGVCSVPLLEVHVDAVDPGIIVSPRDKSVPIPQARVSAPACSGDRLR